MPGNVTLNRLSLVQIHSEQRKQRAHVKRIAEMKRSHGLDNGAPLRFPQIHQNFVKKMNEKRQEITRENEVTSKKILNIMTSKSMHPPIPSHPTNQSRRNHSLHLLHSNSEYFQRIAKTKKTYDVREWRKEFEQHKEHLRISKDSQVFTPLDIGVNRERIKGASVTNSKHATPISSSLNMFQQFDKNEQL